MAKSQSEHDKSVQKLGELIKGIRIAMFSTVDPDGTIHSRPMATQEIEFDGDLWFMTGGDTEKVDDIQRHRDVNISYASNDNNRFVSVSGAAETFRDQTKIDELWNPFYKAWFPDGKDDPNIRLIKVHVERAEYWEAPSNKVVQIVGFVKAAATGKQADLGKNETINLDKHAGTVR